MTETDAVLATIDGALAEYGTSLDAMRWTTEPEKLSPRMPDPVVQIRLCLDSAEFQRAVSEMTRRMRAVGEALRSTARAFARYGQAPPVPVSRVEAARQRRVATVMRRRDRRAMGRKVTA